MTAKRKTPLPGNWQIERRVFGLSAQDQAFGVRVPDVRLPVRAMVFGGKPGMGPPRVFFLYKKLSPIYIFVNRS